MLLLNLNTLMRKMNIRFMRKFLVDRAGINPVNASKMLKGRTDLIRISQIEKICRVMNCTPNDIFEWKPSPKDELLPEHHPLRTLEGKKEELEFLERISTMSTAQLHEVMRKVDDKD